MLALLTSQLVQTLVPQLQKSNQSIPFTICLTSCQLILAPQLLFQARCIVSVVALLRSSVTRGLSREVPGPHEAQEVSGAAHRIEGDSRCGTAGCGEIEGEIRDGMTNGS